MKPLGLSVTVLSRATGITRSQLMKFLRGKARARLTMEMDLRLTHYLGLRAGYFACIQAAYETRQALLKHGKRIAAQVVPLRKQDFISYLTSIPQESIMKRQCRSGKRKRTILPEFAALMKETPSTDVGDDLSAARGDR